MNNTLNMAEFHHIHLHVNNPESFKLMLEKLAPTKEIKHFYVGDKEILHIEFDGINFLLTPANEDWEPGYDHIGLMSSEFEATSTQLLEEGWEMVEEKTNNQSRMRFFKSSEGLLIELLEK